MSTINRGQLSKQIAFFRKHELQECLERLGMKKLGNKPELQQRLLGLFSDYDHLQANGYDPRDQWRVAAAQRIIEDVYDRMLDAAGGNGRAAPRHSPGAPHPAAGAAADLKPAAPTRSGPNGIATGSSARAAGALTSGNQLAAAMNTALGSVPGTSAATRHNISVRCVCGAPQERGTMLQCRADGCGVWQHAQCVGVAQGGHAHGGKFYCELCRARRTDPFWDIVAADIVSPARLHSSGRQANVNGHGMQQIRTTERSFTLTLEQYEELRRSRQEFAQQGPGPHVGECQLQALCLQLNDTVPFRVHWPLNASLSVNGVPYRVYGRGPAQKMGANQRDEPANITSLVQPGAKNTVRLECHDSHVYVLLVVLVRRLEVEQVKQLMALPLSVQDAMDRVCAQVAGEADEDLQTERTVLSLRCPILGSRIRTPGRFREVSGLACFDLDALLDSAQRTRKWQCPVSMTNTSVQSLQVDTYLNRILECLRDRPSVNEVEVDPQARWRPAGSKEPFHSITEDYTPGASANDRANGGNGSSSNDYSDEDELDEREELRQAAAAMTAAGQKRKRAESPDVIVIDSDSDGDAGGGGSNQRVASAAQAAPSGQGQQQQLPARPPTAGSSGQGQQQQLPARPPTAGSSGQGQQQQLQARPPTAGSSGQGQQQQLQARPPATGPSGQGQQHQMPAQPPTAGWSGHGYQPPPPPAATAPRSSPGPGPGSNNLRIKLPIPLHLRAQLQAQQQPQQGGSVTAQRQHFEQLAAAQAQQRQPAGGHAMPDTMWPQPHPANTPAAASASAGHQQQQVQQPHGLHQPRPYPPIPGFSGGMPHMQPRPMAAGPQAMGQSVPPLHGAPHLQPHAQLGMAPSAGYHQPGVPPSMVPYRSTGAPHANGAASAAPSMQGAGTSLGGWSGSGLAGAPAPSAAVDANGQMAAMQPRPQVPNAAVASSGLARTPGQGLQQQQQPDLRDELGDDVIELLDDD